MKTIATLFIILAGCTAIQAQIVQFKAIASGFGTESRNAREFEYFSHEHAAVRATSGAKQACSAHIAEIINIKPKI